MTAQMPAQPAESHSPGFLGDARPDLTPKINNTDVVPQVVSTTPDLRSQVFWAWYNGDAPPDHKPQRDVRDYDPADMPRRVPTNFCGALTGSGKRRYPSAETKRRVLTKQKDRCLYCGNAIGTAVRRGSQTVILRLNWDHFVPFSYGQTNPGSNWVAACHVCNGLKSARMFDTVLEVQDFIRVRWREKGYDMSPLIDIPAATRQSGPPDPTAVAAENAECAERVSRFLQSQVTPPSRNQINGRIGTFGILRVTAALGDLVAGNYAAEIPGLRYPRYSSTAAYDAPPGTPRRMASARPSTVTCPRCGSGGRCFGVDGVQMQSFHRERVALAEERRTAA